VSEEFEFHVEMAIQEGIERGLNPQEARWQALQAFGNRGSLREKSRQVLTLQWIESILQDLKFAARVLRKNPGFTIAAVVTLALGIGANTAIFSLVYGVLLRPLPYHDGSNLVVLHQQATKANLPNVPFSVKEIEDYRAKSSTLESVVEHHTMNFLLLGDNLAERVNTAVVSANFFEVLGVRPLLGRDFTAADDEHGADAVLILSNEYWRTRFGGDPSIIGRVFKMNDRPHTVVGVLPPIPQYPVENDVYMPTSACPFRSNPANIANRQFRMMTAFARVKPGVPVEQVQADLSTVASQIAADHPDVYPANYGYAMSVVDLQTDLTKKARATFFILLGASGFVLLIACANVANLLLARLLKMEREIAVRTALGAGKGRLVRQLLTESMTISFAGGALGLLLAPATLQLLIRFAAQFTTRAAEVRIDIPVLFFTLLVSLATGLLFGLGPAFSSGKGLADAVRQGGRATAGSSRQKIRSMLVVAQVAFSFLLLIGAGLMIRSFVTLEQVNPGFDQSRLLTMRLSPDFSRYTQNNQVAILNDNLLREVSSVSGVEKAGIATNFPFSKGGLARGPGNVHIKVEGEDNSLNRVTGQVDITAVSPGYFLAIRQTILDGRDFNGHDDIQAPLVAIVNQTMARRRWPQGTAVGKRVSLNNGTAWTQVVGVVADVREYGLDRPPKEELYIVSNQNGSAGNLVVRAMGDPSSIRDAVRAAIHKVDSGLAVDRVETIEDLRADSVAAPRTMTMLLALFAGLAVLISASGIAAVMALAVSQRTNELGVRIALGASRESVVMMVLRQGVGLTLFGVAIGVAGGLALTRLLKAVLFSTSPTDPLTFVAVALLFLAVGALACLGPARTVTAIDPVVALRQE
jgi:predicted permease